MGGAPDFRSQAPGRLRTGQGCWATGTECRPTPRSQQAAGAPPVPASGPQEPPSLSTELLSRVWGPRVGPPRMAAPRCRQRESLGVRPGEGPRTPLASRAAAGSAPDARAPRPGSPRTPAPSQPSAAPAGRLGPRRWRDHRPGSEPSAQPHLSCAFLVTVPLLRVKGDIRDQRAARAEMRAPRGECGRPAEEAPPVPGHRPVPHGDTV